MPFDQKLKISEEEKTQILELPCHRIESQHTDLENGDVTEAVTLFPAVLANLSQAGRDRFVNAIVPILFDVMRAEAAAEVLSQIKRRRQAVMPKTVEEALNQIDGPKTSLPWPDGWESNQWVIEAHRQLFGRYLQESALARAKGDGRGIVMAAGGRTYFICAYICVTILRKLGCRLPIELWYLGREEMDHAMEKLLEGMGVRLIDAVNHAAGLPSPPRILAGWTIKLYATLHSSFREVLFLDADQIPARDPTFIFDTPEYQAKGTVLWEDLRNEYGIDITETAFRVFGLPVPKKTSRPDHNKPADYRPVESGQMVVDKARSAPELTLALRMAEHEDFLYPSPPGTRPWHIYGDKSVVFAAWWMVYQKKFGRPNFMGEPPFAMPQSPTWIGSNKAGAFLQHDFDGRVLFSHRVQPVYKWNFAGENHRCHLPNEDMAFETLKDLQKKWNGQIWCYEDQSEKDAAIANRMFGTWEFFRDSQSHHRLHFLPGGKLTGGTDQEQHWRICHNKDEPILVISSQSRATAMLGHDPKNTCWVNHGKNLILSQISPADWQVWEPFDVAVYNSVVRDNEYKLPDDMKGWHVLDIGGHLGSFVRACLDRGADHVITFEPEARNFSTLCRNLAKEIAEGKVTPINAAVWRSDVPPCQLPIERWDDHSAAETVVQGGSKKVSALPLDGFLEQRPIDLMKLDCEGSEYPILLTSRRLNAVKRLVGEWHPVDNPAPHAQVEGHPLTIEELITHLKSQGYRVKRSDHIPNRLGHFWAER